MKLLKLTSAILLSFILLSSCGGDGDDDVCTQSDWTGTYVGTEDCDSESVPVEIMISADGSDSVTIRYEYSDGSGYVEFDPIQFDGCSLSITDSQDGISLTINATIEDSTFTMTEEFSSDGESASCTIAGTKM